VTRVIDDALASIVGLSKLLFEDKSILKLKDFSLSKFSTSFTSEQISLGEFKLLFSYIEIGSKPTSIHLR